ncbi:hypothetical protein FQN57_003372, partial [Myotisia sp. PD_48]
MAQLSREQAREIIDDIREKNGGITQADRERTPLSVLRALENVQRKLGAAVRTLATNLYTTDTRYVFELIQNAEDNSYYYAVTRNVDPFIKFTLSHDRVIVDSNEDGFTEENVRAICSTGESTKANVHGYIGEKGIGFKSVFKIASEVHIQSGPFAFYFEHRAGESGLGMVTPTPEEHQDLPDGVRTRMTLILLDPSRFDACVKEMKEIPHTLTLFLSKLKNIRISIQLAEGLSETTYSCAYDAFTSFMVLTHTFNGMSVQRYYKVVKKVITRLPSHLNRRGRSEAKVVLAFPVSNQSADLKPVCEDQYVFSFLPLRKVGYKFIVQSDFITQASREDILQSAWNDAILDGVADTFLDAVTQFCTHPSLRYLWLNYIPQNIYEQFWGGLRAKIFNRVGSSRVFVTWTGNLNYGSNLKLLRPDYLDENSQPLLRDAIPEIYLSNRYLESSNHKDIHYMGVEKLSWPDILRLIKFYLTRPIFGPGPKILYQSDSWHTKVAELLLSGLDDITIAPQIKALELIPLSIEITGSRLASTASNNIYFPTDQGDFLVPTDLGLLLVDQSSIVNTKRRKLFVSLGVRRCDSQDVIRRIINRYYTPFGVSLVDSVSHIHYLYQVLPEDEGLDAKIFLMDQNKTWIYSKFVTLGLRITVDDIYFEDNDTYGMKEISRAFLPTTEPVVHFLNSSYLSTEFSDAPGHRRSWKDWLASAARVRRVPRLKAPRTDSLSTVFQSISKMCPDKLLGILRTYWSSYGASEKTPVVLEALRDAPVCCENASLKPIQSTYLPLKTLKDKCADLDVIDDMPFARLPTEWPSDDTLGWRFLDELGVGMEANLSFYLDVLRCVVKKTDQSGLTEHRKSSLFKIYDAIYDCCRPEEDADTIRNVFENLEAIYVPSSESISECLSPPSDCVWDGPRFLRTKSVIGFYDAYRENRKIKYLLRRIANIPDAKFVDYIEELKQMSSEGSSVNSNNVSIIYQWMLSLDLSNRSWDAVRRAFEQNRLVYLRSQRRWYPPSSCLWTTAPQIGNQFGVAGEYTDLEKFFVDKLSVQAPTIATYIEQLKNISNRTSPNSNEIQSAIQSINELHPTVNDLDGLKRVKFFPLKLSSGITVFESAETEFFIIDRRAYATSFMGKVTILDFSHEVIHRFQRFLLTMGLTDRYMSTAVEERTTVLHPAMNPTKALTRGFREKAKALSRCVMHFGTDRTDNENETVFRMLREVQIYESEGFSKTFSVVQNGSTVMVESDRGNLHLEEKDDALKIYVPRNQTDRRRCYAVQLPKSLIAHLGIKDSAAQAIFQNVISSEMDILDDILEEEGIIQVNLDPSFDGSDDDETDDAHSEAVSSDLSSDLSSDHAELRPEARPMTPGAPQDHSLEGSPVHGSAPTTPAAIYGFERPLGHLRTSPPLLYPDENQNFQNTIPREHHNSSAYTRLLMQVSEAGRRANFDTGTLNEAVNSTSSASAVLSESPFGIRKLNQLQHDMKIGAAGELFVFELLSRLNLPNFGRDNWRSTIRKEVRSHPEYNGLEPWNGVETADFVYDDAESALTRQLISINRMAPEWRSARPKYFIEVKSTISRFATPFYMSKNQFRRMHDSPIPSSPLPSEIYLVFRVFHLAARFLVWNRYVSRRLSAPLLAGGYQPIDGTEPDVDHHVHDEEEDGSSTVHDVTAGKHDSRTRLKGLKVLLLALPASCDITGTTLMNIGLLFVAT